MMIKIVLTETDIAAIIATKYNVRLSDVSVTAKSVCVGQGPTEHMEYQASAEVRLRDARPMNLTQAILDAGN